MDDKLWIIVSGTNEEEAAAYSQKGDPVFEKMNNQGLSVWFLSPSLRMLFI